MKWEQNPTILDCGYYVFKLKRNREPKIIHISEQIENPQGWWLGPLILEETKDETALSVQCQNCQCWERRAETINGRCFRFPPVDNNWSFTKESEYCLEFIPRIK